MCIDGKQCLVDDCSTIAFLSLSPPSHTHTTLSLSRFFSVPPYLPFFLYPGTNLSYYKGEPEYSAGEPPIQRFNLTGAEAIPDVDVGKRKYAMNIILPSSDETGEIRLIFENVSL